ncbi:C4-type zinc ribbon domain-containing protein [Natroniella acetigena]|uniref:zinc ribbon domain-containing protein n=1 Tax=Natroniella acetigena TaxID=52004 RepID=UPI00200B7A6C|nr:C4-type zinc ribbon domain-containing protein [Natroniella acetigena]MCK8828059.1 C4-type zinc ribbon domain-containing protein [Natroniella acetigena]
MSREELYQLQKLDARKEKLKRSAQNDLETQEVLKLTKQLDQLKVELETKEEEIMQLNKEIKEKEFENARVTRKEEEYKNKLYGETNYSPKELEDFQIKLTKTEEVREQLEEEILEMMMILEQKEEELGSLEEKMSSKTDKIEELKEKLMNKEESIEMKLNKIKENKLELKSRIEEDLLEKYNKLYAKKNARAVVKLEDNYCTGCRMTLPRNLIKKVKQSIEIAFCENCGRILYWEKEEE